MCSIRYYKRGNSVTGARFSHGGGDRLEVSARITVDATDLGDALPMSGTPYRIGMDARADTARRWRLPRRTTSCKT